MKRLDRDAFHWPDTSDELCQVTLKEMRWLCDGLSLDQKDDFKERHSQIVVQNQASIRRKYEKHAVFEPYFYMLPVPFSSKKGRFYDILFTDKENREVRKWNRFFQRNS